MLKCLDTAGRVTALRNNVGYFSWREAASVLRAQKVRCIIGRGAKNIDGAHPHAH